MGTNTIERTALGGGDGDDSRYISSGILEAQVHANGDHAHLGEFQPLDAGVCIRGLGESLHVRRQSTASYSGNLIFRRTQPIMVQRGTFNVGLN